MTNLLSTLIKKRQSKNKINNLFSKISIYIFIFRVGSEYGHMKEFDDKKFDTRHDDGNPYYHTL